MRELELSLKQKDESGGVSSFLIQKTVASLDRFIARHSAGLERRPLRERQMPIFTGMRDFLKDGETEGYIKLPTGVGKTILFTKFIEATRLKTLIVVPTTLLVRQTEKRLGAFAEGIDIGKIYGAAKQFNRIVTITTYTSLINNIRNGKIKADDYELLVLDEVHKSLSKKRLEAVREFTHSIKLGFTATPKFSDDKNVEKLLNTEIHNMSIREAVEADLLSPFSVFIAQSDIDLTKISVTSTGEYNKKELDKAINIAARNQAAVELYKKMFTGRTAIVYCASIKHAEDVARMFQNNGVPADFISGKNTEKEKQAILERYNTRERRVLCNADILIEGFDEPQASVCLNLRPTLSLVLAEQRGGRVLRKDPNNPKKHAYIIDFFDRTENYRNLPVSLAQVAEGIGVMIEESRIGEEKENGINGEEDGSSLNKKEIIISGLKVITDAKEVLRIVREMESKKYQPAPDGWMYLNTIRLKLNVGSYHGLRSKTDMERELHPDWFKYYLDSRGCVREYFAPELVKKVSEYFLNLQSAGEGWLNMNNLRTALHTGDRPIKKLFKPFRNSHPEWFKRFKANRGVIREFYSPELVRLATTELSRFQPAPNEWSTYDRLRKAIKRGATNVKKTASRYKKEHPDWFQAYLDKSGIIREFYSPELIEQIKKDLEVV